MRSKRMIWPYRQPNNVNLQTTQFCSVGANKLELTTSIVPWRNPDTRTIATQTENVAVLFDPRAWFHCIALLAVYRLLERRNIQGGPKK